MLSLAVDIAAKEWTVATGALVELSDVQGILHRLLEESTFRLRDTLMILKFILFELMDSLLGKLALKALHRRDLHSNFRYTLGAAFDVLLASWALQKIE